MGSDDNSEFQMRIQIVLWMSSSPFSLSNQLLAMHQGNANNKASDVFLVSFILVISSLCFVRQRDGIECALLAQWPRRTAASSLWPWKENELSRRRALCQPSLIMRRDRHRQPGNRLTQKGQTIRTSANKRESFHASKFARVSPSHIWRRYSALLFS